MERPRRRPAPQDRPAARPGRRRRRAPGCWRSAPAGASWPCAPPPAGPASTTVTLSQEQRELARQASREAGLADRVDVGCATTGRSTGEYDAIVSVEMIEAVGERLLARLLRDPGRACSRPAAGSRSRRSPCRTTGCSPPGTPTPGSRSTSSPAACSPRSRPSSSAPRPAGLRITSARGCGGHYAETLRLWRERFPDQPAHGRRARLRRGVPPDVDALPRLLARPDSASGYLDVRQFALTRGRHDGDRTAPSDARVAPRLAALLAGHFGGQPAGAAARLGRQRGRAGRRAGRGAALTAGPAPPAVAAR